MVDYRKRLSDMTPEERAEVAPSADNFSKVFGDRTEEPMSVTAADTAVSLATPVDSVVEVQKELQKEEPDYLKIGMLAGVEALGSLPALGPVAKSMIRKGADLAKQTDNIVKLPSKKRSFENFDFNELNLSAAEIEAYADVYNRLGVSKEAITKAEKKIIDTIKAREPKIEKALANALDTNKGKITLQDYKNAVAATTNYGSVEDAAKAFAEQEQLLNKMGTSIAYDMSFDDAVDSVFDVYYSKGASNDDLIESLLNAGYQKELVDYAVTENAIRKSYDKFMSKSADLAKQTDTAIDGTTNIPVVPRTMVVDESLPTKDAANITEEDLFAWKKDPKNTTSDERRKQLKGRDETLMAIAKEYQDSLKANGAEASRDLLAKYRSAVDEINPIKPITTMPELIDNIDVVGALGEKTTTLSKKKTGILSVNRQFRQDEIVTSRLDINGYTNHDKWVAAVRTTEDVAEGFSPTAYGKAVFLKDVDMLQPEGLQKKSLRIAAGAEKGPHAVMQGKYQQLSPEEIYSYAKSVFEDSLKEGSEWVQIGYNPVRAGFFYDRATGLPLEAAQEVIQVGNLVLGKNVKKGNIEEYSFNKGGMAMEEQTQMAFALGGSVEEVDPVSGNEVPPGSLPEEVRDDIDARLSEGEYVVPADVVRYYGVKFFEDLRTQAKAGFEDMEANGRIGGQPVPEENPLPFDVSELQVEEEPVQMNEGGFLDRDALEAKFPASFMGSGSPAQEWKTFENEAGLTITIRYVNGQPMSPIPAGYTEVGARSEQALEVPRGNDSDDPIFPPDQGEQNKFDLTSLSTDELEKLGDGTADAGILEKAVGYTIPLAGTAMRIGREMKAADVNAEIVRRLKSGTNLDGSPLTPEDRAKLGQIFDKTVDTEDSGSGIFGGQRSLTEGLQDTSGDKQVGFADTFLGDLLGFDGQPGIQATDIEGNKLGLQASISGGRRKPVVKESTMGPRSTGRDSRDDDPFKNTPSGTAKVKQSDGSTKTMKTYKTSDVQAASKAAAKEREKSGMKGAGVGGRAKGGLMRKSK